MTLVELIYGFWVPEFPELTLLEKQTLDLTLIWTLTSETRWAGRGSQLNSLGFYNRKCLWKNAFLLWHGRMTRRALRYFLSFSFQVRGFSRVFPAPSSQCPDLPFTVPWQGLTGGRVQASWSVSLQPNSFSTLSAFRTCSYSNLFKYFCLFLFPEMMTFSLDYLFSFVL